MGDPFHFSLSGRVKIAKNYFATKSMVPTQGLFPKGKKPCRNIILAQIEMFSEAGSVGASNRSHSG
jgi:hypothetical protein